jgi:hypothetical protein
VAKRTHSVVQHRSPFPGEAMTMFTEHAFPRHSHDQFGIGVMMSGARSAKLSIQSLVRLSLPTALEERMRDGGRTGRAVILLLRMKPSMYLLSPKLCIQPRRRTLLGLSWRSKQLLERLGPH